MHIVDRIFVLFEQRGENIYLGEQVSQAQHMLQAAHAAELEQASSILIASALLHDIGHLLDDHEEHCAQHGIDSQHEEVGRAWLQSDFGPEVLEPITLHVAAKRYLCAVESDYITQLSPTSVRSLNLQGGPMCPEEVAWFEGHDHFRNAVRVRRWDDLAKDPRAITPPLEHFRRHLEIACNAFNTDRR